MIIPAQKDVPWFQREGVQVVNRIGMAIQDYELQETLFLNLSTLSHPGVTARIVSVTHQTIKNADHAVLHCELCLPTGTGPALNFKVILPLEVEAPVERVENMKITRTRRHPFVETIVQLFNL